MNPTNHNYVIDSSGMKRCPTVVFMAAADCDLSLAVKSKRFATAADTATKAKAIVK